MPISYQGPPPAAAKDLSVRTYVENLLDGNLPQSTVDSLLTTGFAPYATKSYVDTQDALNATKAFIDAGDATKLKLAQKEIVNGIAGLGATGRVNISHVNLPSTQRWPRPYISPVAYNAVNITATGTEVLLYPPVTVADPGFTYKLLVTGLMDGITSVDGEFPIIRVRQGSTTGQLLAVGAGRSEIYVGGVVTPFPSSGIYSIPTWAASVDAVALGGAAGGQAGGGFYTGGNGGGAGQWATATLVRGTTLPVGVDQLNVTVGAGGAGGTGGGSGSGGAGTASTVTAPGVTTVTGAGGAPNNAIGTTAPGASPGNKTYTGQTYTGGAAQPTVGSPGNPPGGGGAGGAGDLFSGLDGGAGAPGEVWIFAYPTANTPTAPIPIVPSAHNAQNSITGATTVHCMLVRSGSAATVTVTTLRPKLYICPIPA